jgi:pimeloyl-ACP methyl ester carboxylesterase
VTVAAVPDGRVRLGDGRILAYGQWGDPDGHPVMLFHGAPGSRLFVPNLLVTAACGVRLVTVDRPGYGGSDPLPGRRILDWPDDVRALADVLGLERFGVLGHSAGGPYALACGVVLADRLAGLVLVSSVVPVEDVPLAAEALTAREHARRDHARRAPVAAARQLTDDMRWLVDAPHSFLELPRPRADQLVLADKDAREMYLATVREGLRQGLDAYSHEQTLERLPWGFRLGDVSDGAHVWHGELDATIPWRHAEALAERLPDAVLTLRAKAGHGLIVQHWGDILRALPSRP